MNKPSSTYEMEMQDPKFKAKYEKSYKKFLFSELLISIMEGDDKSVRKLAKEVDLSPSVIQNIRSGKQQDIKLSNLVRIAAAFGYEVILKNGRSKIKLHDEIRNKKHHLVIEDAA